jgi:hypothetical protein
MTLRDDRHSHKPMRLRFHEQRGVTVSIPDYGKTASAPFYEPMRATPMRVRCVGRVVPPRAEYRIGV